MPARHALPWSAPTPHDSRRGHDRLAARRRLARRSRRPAYDHRRGTDPDRGRTARLAGAPNLALAAAAVAVLGLAFEIYEPPSQALIADVVPAPADRRPTACSLRRCPRLLLAAGLRAAARHPADPGATSVHPARSPLSPANPSCAAGRWRAWSRGRAMAVGYAMLGTGLLANEFATTPPQFAAATVLWSLGDLVLLGRAHSLVATIAAEQARARYFSVYGLCWERPRSSARSPAPCSSSTADRSRSGPVAPPPAPHSPAHSRGCGGSSRRADRSEVLERLQDLGERVLGVAEQQRRLGLVEQLVLDAREARAASSA